MVGMTTSYIFQYIKLGRNKSVKGISDLFVACGFIGNLCLASYGAIYYFLIWPNFLDDLGDILGFLQYFVPLLCFQIFYIQFMYFKEIKTFAIWFFFIISNFILLLLGTLTIVLVSSKKIYNIDDSYDVIILIAGQIFLSVQFIFQMYKTYKIKHPLNLSLPMLCVQIIIYYLLATVLTLQNTFMNGLPFIVIGTLELLLFLECVYFKHSGKVKYNEYSRLNN